MPARSRTLAARLLDTWTPDDYAVVIHAVLYATAPGEMPDDDALYAYLRAEIEPLLDAAAFDAGLT